MSTCRESVGDKPSKMQPIIIKIKFGKKQAMFTNMDTEKPEEVESLEKAAFKPLLSRKQGGIWVAFDKSLLDTLNAGLFFTLTNDGQVKCFMIDSSPRKPCMFIMTFQNLFTG